MASEYRGSAPRHNGETLKTIRIIRGLSRQELAARAAPASYSHIANLETETKVASPELLHRIALALDVPVGALLREPLFTSEQVPA